MAFAVTKLTITVEGVDYTGDVSTNAVSIAVPYAAKGAAVTVKSATCTDATGAITCTPASAITVPSGSAVNVVVKDSAGTPNTATVALTVTMAEGAGVPGMLTYPGWFKFRRLSLNIKYVTNGVALDGIKEVLAVQSDKVVAYQFDEASQTLKLFTATNTQVSNNTVLEIVLLILEQ